MSENKDIVRFNNESVSMVAWAKKFKVENEATKTQAGEFNSNVKKHIKAVQDFFDPLKKEARLPWKKLCDRESGIVAEAKEASGIIGKKLSDYQLEQDKIYEAKKAKAEEEARKAEEKRKKELQKQAEQHMEKGNHEKAQARLDLMDQVHVHQKIVEKPQAGIVINGKKIAQQEHLEIIIDDEEKAIAANIFPAHCMKLRLAEVKTYIKANRISHVPGLRIEKRYIQKG